MHKNELLGRFFCLIFCNQKLNNMTNLMLMVPKMAADDYVGFTFFVGCMAMMAAAAFFFLSMNQFDRKWRTSILVSGLITFIAAVHYYYMRDYWATPGNGSPVFFRYVDWILTVPLMCVEFYLILKPSGAKQNLLWTLIGASVVMLVTGYWGEAIDRENAAMWGLISGLAYFYIVYLIMFGEAKALATKAGGDVLKAHNMLCKFVLIGWAIYPIGYMAGTVGWYGEAGEIFGMELAMDVIYNIGDAINKIGFGLVVYSLAVASTKEVA